MKHLSIPEMANWLSSAYADYIWTTSSILFLYNLYIGFSNESFEKLLLHIATFAYATNTMIYFYNWLYLVFS